MADTVRDWNLLNEAQRIIPQLSAAQRGALYGGHAGLTTRKALKRLGLFEQTVFQKTELGVKVLEILRARRAVEREG